MVSVDPPILVCYRLDDPTAIAIYERVKGRIREQTDQARREPSDDQSDVIRQGLRSQ
jgi:hypothetical protein